MSEDKKYIEAPDIPNVVQGDGRYFANLLRKYLATIAEQVNLANGFEANEEIGQSGISPPAHFTLTFSMNGGLFQWSYPNYINRVKYYEIRKDTHVGTMLGLIDRTVENHSSKMPTSYAGTIYLYAVLTGGTASNGSRLDYNKARPEAPQDISLTKNDQGTIVNYTWVPTDCMGAHIYINGVMYDTPDNLFLYKGDSEKISEVSVAYYDCFGEGERATIHCNVPTVTGFIVERNGSMLDFYWQSIGINGASYMVRAAKTNQWKNGIDLFETSLLKKKLEFPSMEDTYFLIKAKDEHGNYSAEAAWFFLSTENHQQKNVILTNDEESTLYSGNKIGTYYDAKNHGLRLTEGNFSGEYITTGTLPYKASARSWAEYSMFGISDSDITVSDLNFSTIDDRAKLITAVGGVITDIGGTYVKTYISTKQDSESSVDLAIPLNGDLLTGKGESPTVSQHTDTFDYGRWFKGLSENELTRLKYELPQATEQFGFTFSLKTTAKLNPCTIFTLTGTSCSLELSYNDLFTLKGSDGNTITLDVDMPDSCVMSIGVSQSATERTLFVKLSNTVLDSKTQKASINAKPVGKVQYLSFYKETV